MALVLKDRVKQTATAPGTGTITLLTTPTGFQAFSAVGDGNTTYFAIVDPTSGAWEVNYGTYTSSGTTLSRNSPPLSSSNSGSLVNFTGAVDVFLTYPSGKAVWQDTAGVVAQQSFGAITATSAVLTTGTVSTTPSSGIDIANKTYVDTVAADGIHYHEAVFVESPNTAGNLTATYTGGGTNANIIQIANGTDITFFGVSAAVGDQFLTSTGNGLLANTPYYIVADLGGNTYQISLTYGGADVTGLTNGSVTLPSVINPGVGATLTNAGTKAALTIDGVLMTVGKRVLIYNQTNGFENGVYTVTTVGTPDPGGTNWVLTRATDADTYSPSSSTALGQGDAFYVTNGDTGAGETYVVTTNGDIFFGITNITFAQISSAQVYNAGTGLNLSPATTFNISNTGVTANTYGSASAVPVITVNAQGQATGITNTNIAINGTQVSGNISGSAGSVANALTLGTYLTGTSFNGSAAVTATVDATSANTASKVVARDVSGNFSAGTITATLSGSSTSATTATNLAGGAANQIPYQTAAGTTSFITAASGTNYVLNYTGSAFSWVAGTISGVALGSNLNALTAGTYLTSGGTYTGATARTFAVDATDANTASKVVARDASGNFSANVITAALTGNASTATTATNVSGGTASVTTLTTSSTVTLNGGTANGVAYLNASKVLTSGTSFVFDGTRVLFGRTTSDVNNYLIQTYAVSGSQAGILFTYGGVGSGAIFENSSGALVFGNDGASGQTTRFQIGSAGQLGIGGATYGTSGQVLTSGGSGAAPTWATPGGGSAATPTALGTVYGKTTDYAVTSTFETSLGYQAGAANTSTSITAVGNRALQQNTSGFANTAVGKDAANGNTTGGYLTAVGYQALGGGSTGNYNTAVGYNSLANTAGTYTVAIGYQAMMSSASNGNNVAIGSNAAKTLTGSGYNTVVGSEAMPVATSGSGTTAVGYGALSQLSTGSQNTVIGVSAGNTVTTGANNVFVGAYANGPIASQYVTMVGASAGQGSDSGNYSTYVGYAAYPSASGAATNEIVLGALCRGKGSNTIAIGKSANYVYLDFTTDNTWTRLSDKRLKTNIKPENTGLDFINRLSPVTFNWKPSFDIPKELTSHYSETNEKNTDAVVAGFIAQDVKKALDESNATNNLGWRCDEEGVQSLAEGVFILPLVNAVKELSAKLDALEAKHNAYVASHP